MALGETLVGVGAVLTPITVFGCTVLTLRGQGKLRAQVTDVKQQVETANGKSLGVLADSAEGRRILADVAKDDRTTSEQGYVDRLKDNPSG